MASDAEANPPATSKGSPGGSQGTAAQKARQDLVKEVSRVPIAWTVAMAVAALFTAVQIDRAANGEIAVSFGVGTETLVALALIWLPMLLRVFALVGGSFKAGGVEANLPGFLSHDDAIDLSVKTRQVTAATDEGERTAAAVDLQESIARLAVPALEPDDVLPNSVLTRLARSYERLRREMSPSSSRTAAMTRVVNEARVRASNAPKLAASKGGSLVRSTAQGDRIVGLALVQETAT